MQRRIVEGYIAQIDGKRGAYGATFPDLPGCTAMGETVDTALTNAAVALRDWIDVMREAGYKAPHPRR
ncbi:MAG TPA: type II toxin-antitoxin system HicB family antitoxin [Rhizomicrobium sp.]